MKVTINPGSGPVENGGREQSEINIQQFIKDLSSEDIQYEFVEYLKNGRHLYKLWNKTQDHEVAMPALPLEQVRYLGLESQKVWDFPRLFIDGSSWLWEFALKQTFCNSEEDTK